MGNHCVSSGDGGGGVGNKKTQFYSQKDNSDRERHNGGFQKSHCDRTSSPKMLFSIRDNPVVFFAAGNGKAVVISMTTHLDSKKTKQKVLIMVGFLLFSSIREHLSTSHSYQYRYYSSLYLSILGGRIMKMLLVMMDMVLVLGQTTSLPKI